MNRILIKYILLGVIFIAGLSAAFVGYSMGAGSDYMTLLNLTDIEAAVSSYGVVSLDIDTSYVNVEIEASNEAENLEIIAENISREYLRYNISNNIFSLKYSFNKWYEVSSVPFLLKDPGNIKITVPASVSLQDIQIKSGMGSMYISYLTAENMYIDCGSNENSLKSITAEYMEISGGSGELNAESIFTDHLLFTGGRGNTSIRNFQTEKAELRSGSGDLSLAGIIDGTSIIESGMGDVNAELYGNSQDYMIEVLNGKAAINGNDIKSGNNMGDADKSKYRMNISSGMGDIKIDFKK